MKSKIIAIAVVLVMALCVCCAGCTSTEQPQSTDVKTVSPTVLATDKPTETPTVIPLSKDDIIGNWLCYSVVTEKPYFATGAIFCFKGDGTGFLSMFSSQDSELKTIKLIGNTSTSDVLGNLEWKKIGDNTYLVNDKMRLEIKDNSFQVVDETTSTVNTYEKCDVENQVLQQ